MKRTFNINNFSVNLFQLIFVVIFGVTCLTGTAMFVQYIYLKRHSDELIRLQGEYRGCLRTLKSMIDEFQKVSEQGNSCLTDEKKNFLVVNRSPEYLKKSLIKYLKENNLEYELAELTKSNFIPDSTIRQPIRRMRPARTEHESSYYLIRSLGDISFSWPLDFNAFWISSYFGPRKNADRSNGFHYGLDLAALSGTIVKASGSGTVKQAGYSPGYGNTIVIHHDKKYKTRYAHLKSIKVKIGEKVQRGQKIGTVGNTGLVRSSGRDASHLHFEVYVRNKRINPLWVLPKIKLKN